MVWNQRGSISEICLYSSSYIVISGLPQWLSGTEPSSSAGDTGDTSLTPGLGRSPGGGHGNSLQYSCLESPVDGGA